MLKKNDFKFSIRVLEERLKAEREFYKKISIPIYQHWTEHRSDDYCNIESTKNKREWRKTNMDSCLYRISDLENCIEFLKTQNNGKKEND